MPSPIERRGAACRDKAGKQSGDAEQRGDGEQSWNVSQLNAK
jgi:hypothetical protein